MLRYIRKGTDTEDVLCVVVEETLLRQRPQHIGSLELATRRVALIWPCFSQPIGNGCEVERLSTEG